MNRYTVALALASGALGIVSLYVSARLERWHSQQFSTHTDRLGELSKQDNPDPEIQAEVQRFHDDTRIDWAIDGMVFLRCLGILLLGVAGMMTAGVL